MLDAPLSKLTWLAEGSDDSETLFFHWPGGPSSGPTLGKGLDFGNNSKKYLMRTLDKAGIPWHSAFEDAVGLKGNKAKDFVVGFSFSHTEPVINLSQQIALFNIVYKDQEKEVIRISTENNSVVNKYGNTNVKEVMDNNPILWQLAVDLKYRGDYHPKSRERFQKHLVLNSNKHLLPLMSDTAFWMERFKVPRNRFELRIQHVKGELK